MMMLGVERMSAEEVSAVVNISYRADWWISDGSGGANLVWMLQVQLYRGLATSNYSAVDEAFQSNVADCTNTKSVIDGHSNRFFVPFSWFTNYSQDLMAMPGQQISYIFILQHVEHNMRCQKIVFRSLVSF